MARRHPAYVARVLCGVCTCVLVVALVLAAVLRGPVWSNTEANHEDGFVPASFTVIATGLGGHTCAEPRDCTCEDNAGAPVCGSLVQNGTCDGGFLCCAHVCERCGGPNKPQCCRCQHEVDHQSCTNYIGRCYQAWAEVQFRAQMPPAGQVAAYNSCRAQGGTESSCSHLLLSRANVTETCGIDDKGCATSFVAALPTGLSLAGVYVVVFYSAAGRVFERWSGPCMIPPRLGLSLPRPRTSTHTTRRYNRDNVADVHLGVPAFTPPVSLMVGIALSAAAAAVGCAGLAVAAFCHRRADPASASGFAAGDSDLTMTTAGASGGLQMGAPQRRRSRSRSKSREKGDEGAAELL